MSSWRYDNGRCDGCGRGADTVIAWHSGGERYETHVCATCEAAAVADIPDDAERIALHDYPDQYPPTGFVTGGAA